MLLRIHFGTLERNPVRRSYRRIRIRQHKGGVFDGFTKEYKVDRLMYFEIFHESAIAEARERQVKKYRRAKKVALFARSNPGWKDLSEEILSRSIKDLLM